MGQVVLPYQGFNPIVVGERLSSAGRGLRDCFGHRTPDVSGKNRRRLSPVTARYHDPNRLSGAFILAILFHHILVCVFAGTLAMPTKALTVPDVMILTSV